MGFNEGRFLAGIDRRRKEERIAHEKEMRHGLEVSPAILRLHQKFKRDVFSNSAYTVQSPEFFSVYGEEAVKNDMRDVLRLKTKMTAEETPEIKKMKILSETFEGLVLVNVKENKWFGEDATFFKTSQYDDLKNKTDMYGEWFDPKEGSRVLALAIDLTFSGMKGASKLDHIRAEIDRGELGKIRYFKDARGDIKGTRYNVPRIVLGVGARELADLASLSMRNQTERLANHPVRDMLIREMATQLSGMERYATKNGKHEVARAYQQSLAAVEPLVARINRSRFNSSDPVLTTIEARMKTFE